MLFLFIMFSLFVLLETKYKKIPFFEIGFKEQAVKYFLITGVSYKWYASVACLPNLYSVID